MSKKNKGKSEDIESIRSTEERIKKKKRKITTEGDDEKVSKKPVTEHSDDIDDAEVEGVQKKPKGPSKRQLKREKAEQRQVIRKVESQNVAVQRAINYISKWKHAKSEWKFEKLRQIWLMDHLLDDTLVPDSIFLTVLEYFEGCKGMARQQLVKKMMEVIKKVEDLQTGENEDKDKDKDEDEEEEENEEESASASTDTAEYKRARQVLQALPTEAT